MFHLIALDERFFHLKILFSWRWMLERGDEFLDRFPRLSDGLVHRGVILRDLEIFGLAAILLDAPSDHVRRLGAQS